MAQARGAESKGKKAWRDSRRVVHDVGSTAKTLWMTVRTTLHSHREERGGGAGGTLKGKPRREVNAERRGQQKKKWYHGEVTSVNKREGKKEVRKSKAKQLLRVCL